jgi:hypothetical protein
MRTPVAGMTTTLEVAQTYPETSQTLVDDLLAPATAGSAAWSTTC